MLKEKHHFHGSGSLSEFSFVLSQFCFITLVLKQLCFVLCHLKLVQTQFPCHVLFLQLLLQTTAATTAVERTTGAPSAQPARVAAASPGASSFLTATAPLRSTPSFGQVTTSVATLEARWRRRGASRWTRR